MSGLEFKIVEWMPSEHQDLRFANSAAELKISVNNICATTVFDSWSKTVTERVRLPMYPLAEWFAANWWRLHCEPSIDSGGRPSLDWRLSHDLAGIGGGFVWPTLRFSPDDKSMQVSQRAFTNARWEPLRYLNDIPSTSIPVQEFDAAVDALINLVLARLNALQVPAEPLASLWADVLIERSEPEVAQWRAYEARLGYDADEAPDSLISEIDRLSANAGRKAAEEILPVLRPNESETIAQLMTLSAAPGVSADTSSLVAPPEMYTHKAPWDAGRNVARWLRQEIGKESGPIKDRDLAGLLGFDSNALHQSDGSGGVIGLGVRKTSGSGMVLHFRKRNPAGRRFEAARFLVDSLTTSAEDHWLPLTDRGSARQKTQRAFAAEFLAPIDDLTDFLGLDRTVERMDEAGEAYGVSPLAIRSQLANHGLLAQEEVVV